MLDEVRGLPPQCVKCCMYRCACIGDYSSVYPSLWSCQCMHLYIICLRVCELHMFFGLNCGHIC